MTPITAHRPGCSPSSRRRRVGVVAAAACLALTACTNSGEDDSASDTPREDDAQVVRSDQPAAGGDGCTLEKYGVDEIDLSQAVVGFSQSEPETAAFRKAETDSIKQAAEDAGVKQLIATNANAELTKQISDIQDLINQNVDVLIVAPVNSDGLDPALADAKQAGIPVLTVDRKITNEPCSDYLAFLGSDFYEQGVRAADALAEATDENAKVAILLGSSGNNVTDQRNAGFKDTVAEKYPDIEIVAEQTGDFARDKGQEVAETLLQSNPEITAFYAHNDEMGIGAVTAIRSTGKQPGTDVKVVSIDGIRDAVQAIVDGEINAVIESNPRFGPLAFQTLETFYSGEPVAEDIIIEDDEYTPENAEADLGKAY